MNKNGTLQAVEMLTANNINENLKKKYGTSVNEYMSREHSKEVLQEINLLRGLFEKYGKTKTSSLSLDELQDFLIKINVKNINIIIIQYIANSKSYNVRRSNKNIKSFK